MWKTNRLKNFGSIKFIFYFFLFFCHSFVGAEGLSFEEIKNRSLSREVVFLKGGTYKDTFWSLMREDKDLGYQKMQSVGGSQFFQDLKGQRGVVVFVALAEAPNYGKNVVGKLDVFGKEVDSNRSKDPYVSLVINFAAADKLIGVSGYYSVIFDEYIQYSSKVDALKRDVEGALSALMGKKLYKTGYTVIIDPAIGINDLLDKDKRESYRVYKLLDNLTPLKVVDVKYFEEAQAVVIKVELPDGLKGLLFGSLEYYSQERKYKRTRLERMGVSAEEKIPSEFSKEEVKAIRGAFIFRGMSREALFWSWGFAGRVNDWGLGGSQYIYNDRQYVYVDGGKIRDWQTLQ